MSYQNMTKVVGRGGISVYRRKCRSAGGRTEGISHGFSKIGPLIYNDKKGVK